MYNKKNDRKNNRMLTNKNIKILNKTNVLYKAVVISIVGIFILSAFSPTISSKVENAYYSSEDEKINIGEENFIRRKNNVLDSKVTDGDVSKNSIFSLFYIYTLHKYGYILLKPMT